MQESGVVMCGVYFILRSSARVSGGVVGPLL